MINSIEQYPIKGQPLLGKDEEVFSPFVKGD
jgi:hypothetical protein